MKKILIMIFVSCLTTVYAKAQDSSYTKTLIKSQFKNPFKSIKYLGYYITPEYQYVYNNSVFNSNAGLSAMVIINKKLAFGPNFNTSFSPSNRIFIGGLRSEFTIKPDGLLHLTIPLLVGFGASSNYLDDFQPDFRNGEIPEGGQMPDGRQFGRPERGHHSDFDGFRIRNSRFMLQPGMNAELNLVKNIKFFVGASFRFFPVINIENNNQSKSTFTNGVAFQSGLKIGLFDQNVSKSN